MRRIARGESVKHLETVRICKDRRLIDISATISPIVDQAGNIIGASKIARDITDRKQMQQQLKESDAAFRGMFDQSAVGVAHMSLDGRLQLVNQRFADILGRTREQLQGSALDQIQQPDGESGEARMLQRLLVDEVQSFAFEGRYRKPSGSFVWISMTASLVRDAYGAPFHIVAIMEDIDVRKQMELQLLEREEQFRTMANAITQLAWIARADGEIYWYNDRWYEYFGTTPEQMERQGWKGLHDPSVLPDVLAKWNDSLARGKPFDMEFPLRGGDGKYRTFLTRICPVKDQVGNVTRWVGTNTDVEALKQAEEEIRVLNAELEQRVDQRTSQLEVANRELRHSQAEIKSIFESLPGLYLVLTPTLTIVSASDAYLKATLTTREGILGRKLFDIFPFNPDQTDDPGVTNLKTSLDRVVKNAVADTMAIQRYDVRRPDQSFEERYWSPINSPVFDADRRIKYIVHRVEEVTEFMHRKTATADSPEELSSQLQQMEAEVFRSSQTLQETNLKLEAANKEMEAFSYSVSHDLRAPLRGMDGYVRMLKEDFADRLGVEGDRMLNVVSSEARRMGRLIDDLLAFSRLGRLPIDRVSIDMTELARNSCESATADLSAKPQFSIEPLPEAQGDIAMLRQVFANLVGNAVKFSAGRATPMIEIGSSTVDGQIVYYVKDNGVGFDEKYSHKLFAVFQRLHSETDFEGTGVGLALVQRVILRHGGKVWAEGTPGSGATFFFTLPN